jgi:phage anti-repressor protein
MLNLLNLENFLIENSKISKNFITDFFGFQKKTLYNKYEPFIINLEDIAFWLETRKTTLKETLSLYYSKNIDYIIVKSLLQDNLQQISNRGGHNKKLVILTSDCFKMLCMRSKTKKANKIREYYLELEKLIDKYKDIIIEEKDNKIKILENDLKKEIYPSGNYSYIFQEKDELGETFFRIGQSGNLKSRMANHNSSSIHKKIISFKIKTDNKLQFESCLRNSMFNFRYKNNKDYYKIPNDKVKEVIKICKNIVKNFKNNNNNNIMSGGYDNTYNNDYIYTKKMDLDIKKLFSKICQCTMWNMYENPSNAYYNGRKISSNKLNEIILPKSISNRILIVPVHRFEDYVEYINLSKNDITLKKLLNILFNYYNEEITLEQLNLIPNDIDDYVKEAKQKHKTKKVYRINIIGSLCRYEGIREIYEPNIYKLILGS